MLLGRHRFRQEGNPLLFFLLFSVFVHGMTSNGTENTFIAFIGDAAQVSDIKQIVAEATIELIENQYKFVCLEYKEDTNEKIISIYCDTLERFLTKICTYSKKTSYKFFIENDILGFKSLDDDVYVVKIAFDDLGIAVILLLDLLFSVYTKASFLLVTIYNRFYDSDADLRGDEAIREAREEAMASTEDLLNEIFEFEIRLSTGRLRHLHERIQN